MMGKVAIDLLVVTRFPTWGPLPAVILAGPVPAVSSSRLAGSTESAARSLVMHWSPLFVPLLSGGSIKSASIFTGGAGTGVPHTYCVAGGVAESQHSMLVS